MAYAILQKDSPTLTLSRAGHDAPLHYSRAPAHDQQGESAGHGHRH